jgi:hypothetical protein
MPAPRKPASHRQTYYTQSADFTLRRRLAVIRGELAVLADTLANRTRRRDLEAEASEIVRHLARHG